MLTVGVFARVETAERERLRERLAPPTCLDVFELEEPNCIGLVIQARDSEAAHDWLQKELRQMPGVLCAWPVHTELDTSPLQSE